MLSVSDFNRSAQTLWNSIHYAASSFSQSVESLCEKTTEIVTQVALPVFNRVFTRETQEALELLKDLVISAALLYFHNITFQIGLITGFLLHRHVREIVDEINNCSLHNNPNQSWYFNFLKKTFLIGVIGVYCILNMPTVLPTMAFYFAAKWGAILRAKCREGRDPTSLTASQPSLTASQPVLIPESPAS